MGEYRPVVLTVRTERREVRTKKDRAPIFSQYGPEQAWLISYTTEEVYTTEGYTTEESKDCKDTSAESLGTMPGPILIIYWTGNRAF